MSHVKASAHCGAIRDVQFGGDAVHGVRIVSSLLRRSRNIWKIMRKTLIRE